MIAMLLLICWLIACIYVPFLLWITEDYSPEERRLARLLRLTIEGPHRSRSTRSGVEWSLGFACLLIGLAFLTRGVL